MNIELKVKNLGKCNDAGCQMVRPTSCIQRDIYRSLYIIRIVVSNNVYQQELLCKQKNESYLQTDNVEQGLIIMSRDIINLITKK